MFNCNGIPFSLDDVLRYGLEVDNIDLEAVDSEYQDQMTAMQLEFEDNSPDIDLVDTSYELDAIIDVLRECNDKDDERIEEAIKNVEKVSTRLYMA